MVEDTAQRVSDPDPRVTAAVHSAFEIANEAKAAAPGDFDSWSDWEHHFTRRCGLIAVLYGDTEAEVVHNNFNRATGGTTFDTAAAGHAAAADTRPATASKAQTQCEVR